MSKSPAKAEAFLAKMNLDAEPQATPALPALAAIAPSKARPANRTGLKHIGGYFDRDTVEKVAVLRARLDLDNSELLKLAIDDLHRKHTAQRAFGDV